MKLADLKKTRRAIRTTQISARVDPKDFNFIKRNKLSPTTMMQWAIDEARKISGDYN